MSRHSDDALVAVPRILVLRVFAVVTAVLVVLGVSVRIFTASHAGELESVSILTIPGKWQPTDDDPMDIATVVGFVGLSVCAAVAAVLSLAQWGGRLGRRTRVIGLTVGVLLAVGGLVPLTLVLVAATRSITGETAGPGMLFYYLGVLGFMLLMSRVSDPLRRQR
ncbi:hypothetical protein [Ruania halotolerans]|uniref:hypothetical protein n=1 Tax=Ruania halotolerans TaxID=2897773 RepID=UPI001E58D4B6|nr:hypothetical protein [Ruania halotolerans]UFU07482.1 hypothetical protein LQF10_05090 [Ruania halotolerans]